MGVVIGKHLPDCKGTLSGGFVCYGCASLETPEEQAELRRRLWDVDPEIPRLHKLWENSTPRLRIVRVEGKVYPSMDDSGEMLLKDKENFIRFGDLLQRLQVEDGERVKVTIERVDV